MTVKKVDAERYSEMFWLNDDGLVVRSRGFTCTPSNKYWWFPKLGYSTSDVYKNKKKAESEASKTCVKNITMWTKRLNQIS